jgi:transcriptional regulator with XRE-family HTH domain
MTITGKEALELLRNGRPANQLAVDLGMNRGQLSRFLHGQRPLSPFIAEHIAKCLSARVYREGGEWVFETQDRPQA